MAAKTKPADANAYAVILAGGRGERFWPMSTHKRPKQLLSLVGDRTLIAQAVDRLEGFIPPDRVFVITNADLVAETRKAAPDLPAENIIGEPMGKDTAAAAALGTALVAARDPRGVVCILTADHIIGKVKLFRQTLEESARLAASRPVIVTIGITPTEPSTAYGYIETGAIAAQNNGITFFQSKRFVEKPPHEKAVEYVKGGRHYWNSGMFVWSVDTFKNALVAHRPPLYAMMQRLLPEVGTKGFASAFQREYEQLEKISIDYAVMEKADNILMARGEFAWDDVGSWTALENHFPKDDDGNTALGDTETVDCHGNIVLSRGRLTALIGVKDMIVVQTDGVTLVCPKDRAQDIKKLVVKIRDGGRHPGVL